jgi:phosphoenolpyruvate carboxykinase (ATP)
MEGFFQIANYFMPKRNILPLAASANCDKNDEAILFLGAPASGRTALSVATNDFYVGDTHQGWSPDGIFNLYGGVYPKLNTLEDQNMLKAISFGTVVENASFYKGTRQINFKDNSLSKNARASLANSCMPNAKQPAMCGHPAHIIFLVNDPSGVFPAVAKLSPD